MFFSLGVDRRHSVFRNDSCVLFDGEEPKREIGASELAVESARKCQDSGGIAPSSISLLLGVTSSPGWLLLSLVCDVMAMMPELPWSAVTLSIS